MILIVAFQCLCQDELFVERFLQAMDTNYGNWNVLEIFFNFTTGVAVLAFYLKRVGTNWNYSETSLYHQMVLIEKLI